MDVGGMSPGTQLNRFMDGMGFPDKLGDMYGMSLDKAIGNDLGVARNMLDLFSPLSTSQLDKMMGGGFAGPGFCPRPHDNYGHNWGVSKHTHYDREKINVYKEPGLAGLFGKKDVMIDGKKVDVGNDWGVTPKQLEAKILTDPNFRAKIEGQVGGRIVLDGNADGNITIAKKMHHPMVPYHNHCHQHVGNMLGRMVPGMMNGVLNQMGGFLQGIGQGIGQAVGGILGGQQQQGAQGAGAQQGGVGQAAGGQGGADELTAILKNPNMSFEAKLAQFMMKFMEKKQKEIEGKMEQMKSQGESGDAAKAGGAGGGKGGGGFIGGLLGGGGGAGGGGFIGGMVGGLLGGGGGGGGLLGGILGGGGGLGGLMQMGGGLVGGMFGGPIGASLGSQLGGAVGGAMGGGGQAGQAGGQGGAGGADASGKGKGSEQIAMKELETMMQAFQRMMESMGNVLKSVHDMSMSSARLIR